MTTFIRHGMPWLLTLCLTTAGCVKAPSGAELTPFEARSLDACLTIVVDLSGSFSAHWEDKAFELFRKLMDQFFTEGTGGESRVVLAQLSGADDVVLFEGSPADLRARFGTPEELSAFLRDHSDPYGSQVYHATEKAIGYVCKMPGVTPQTRLMTVVLSDMVDSGFDSSSRSQAGTRMVQALTAYRELGGGLALYYVAKEETGRWLQILQRAGFQPGAFVIENTLVANPQLPRFD